MERERENKTAGSGEKWGGGPHAFFVLVSLFLFPTTRSLEQARGDILHSRESVSSGYSRTRISSKKVPLSDTPFFGVGTPDERRSFVFDFFSATSFQTYMSAASLITICG